MYWEIWLAYVDTEDERPEEAEAIGAPKIFGPFPNLDMAYGFDQGEHHSNSGMRFVGGFSGGLAHDHAIVAAMDAAQCKNLGSLVDLDPEDVGL
jgi:hypothetical protein